MTISVIVPVHNGESYLERSLSALCASTRMPDEILVVDDGSTDETARLARRLGARLITLSGGPCGPAVARNRGALQAHGEILVFLDADVVVHATTLERIASYLDLNPHVAAVFGSYDDHPSEPGLVSRYKNLLHHFTHQHSRRDASTFWAGCGAIRQSVFSRCGGFDESFLSPSIEDIDLGLRLTRAGYRVWSCPDVQATHLKRWTLFSLIHTDVFHRAIPWTRLILRTRSLQNDLNTSLASRCSALAAWVLALVLLVSPLLPWALLGLLPAIAILLACNARLLRFFYLSGSARFVAAAAGLHFLYYIYSSLAFALVAMDHGIKSAGVVPWNLRDQRLPEAKWGE